MVPEGSLDKLVVAQVALVSECGTVGGIGWWRPGWPSPTTAWTLGMGVAGDVTPKGLSLR